MMVMLTPLTRPTPLDELYPNILVPIREMSQGRIQYNFYRDVQMEGFDYKTSPYRTESLVVNSE